MNVDFTFPFSQKVHPVQQTDRTPKTVFVLGVYASAVHAAWLSRTGRTIVRALAVASEPCIFWRGEDAQRVIAGISIPTELGTLTPADDRFNGPSGRALDEHFLQPLGVDRARTWLCDLLPHTRLNPGQFKAIKEKYNPKRTKYSLPAVTIPKVPTQFADANRRQEILSEIQLADPKLVILLGDQPIKWFLRAFSKYGKLAQFGESESTYGKVHPLPIEDSTYNILPLVHPRQAGGLSSHSVGWNGLHRAWVNKHAREIAQEYLQG
jgi:uracil-DNA glycosylase